ncbi:hypothetical protein ACVWZR_001897 [Bradyrhizobium sp. i1.3.1]
MTAWRLPTTEPEVNVEVNSTAHIGGISSPSAVAALRPMQPSEAGVQWARALRRSWTNRSAFRRHRLLEQQQRSGAILNDWKWAAGRVTATSRSIRKNPSATHCASRERRPPMPCRPGLRAGLGWIDRIGLSRIGCKLHLACRDPVFGGLDRYSRPLRSPFTSSPDMCQILAQSLLTGRANAAGPPHPNPVRLKCRQ